MVMDSEVLGNNSFYVVVVPAQFQLTLIGLATEFMLFQLSLRVFCDHTFRSGLSCVVFTSLSQRNADFNFSAVFLERNSKCISSRFTLLLSRCSISTPWRLFESA